MDVCGPMPALPLGTKMATGDDAKPATPASAPRAQGPQTPEVAGLSDRKLKANPKKSHDRKPLKSPKDAMQESQDSVPDPKKSMQEARNPEKSVQESRRATIPRNRRISSPRSMSLEMVLVTCPRLPSSQVYALSRFPCNKRWQPITSLIVPISLNG